jgi:flagellar hook protein FlgE
MSFEIALSGIDAVNTGLDVISNNIANAGTYGFKSSRANFASMYAGLQPTGAEVGSTTQTIDVGGGVLTTGRPMDASIQGRGFFVSKDTSGQSTYSRVGIFSVDASGYVVDGSGRRAQGFGAASAGGVGVLGDIKVPTGQIAAMPTGKLDYVGNLSSDWTPPVNPTFDHTDPTSFNSSTVSVVYDSLGAQHTLTQYFVSGGPGTVTTHYTFDGTDLPATSTLSFDTNGQLTAPVGPQSLALGTPAGASPLTINLDYTGTTQFAGQATTLVNAADGYASGTQTGVSIAADGSVQAQYSNGQKMTVGTLAVATFPDEGKLTAVSDTSWVPSVDSGNALYFAPGTGIAGKLTTGALEQSNVDMTGQLVELMTAQRNYQANTKVISAQSDMAKTLMQAI